MEEYQDAINRSKRLAICRDISSNKGASFNVVTKEDLEIYSRWMICHLHSAKHIHSFIKVIARYLFHRFLAVKVLKTRSQSFSKKN